MARRHCTPIRLFSAPQSTASQAVQCAGYHFFALHTTFRSATAEGVSENQLAGQRLNLRSARKPNQATQIKRPRLRSHPHNFRSSNRRREIRAERSQVSERAPHAESADQVDLLNQSVFSVASFSLRLSFAAVFAVVGQASGCQRVW